MIEKLDLLVIVVWASEVGAGRIVVAQCACTSRRDALVTHVHLLDGLHHSVHVLHIHFLPGTASWTCQRLFTRTVTFLVHWLGLTKPTCHLLENELVSAWHTDRVPADK